MSDAFNQRGTGRLVNSMVDQKLSHKFRNGLSFEYLNKRSRADYLLVETKKFVGIGKAIEGKIKPVRVFNL